MTEEIRKLLVGIQTKIQNLTTNTGNSGYFQQLLHEASELIRLYDEVDAKNLKELRDELNFYVDEREDNFVLFHKCKAESLTIIAKYV